MASLYFATLTSRHTLSLFVLRRQQYTLCTHNNENLHTYLTNYNSVYFALQSAFNFENEPTRKNLSNYTQGRYVCSPVRQLYQHLQSLKEERFSFQAPSHNNEWRRGGTVPHILNVATTWT